MVLAARCRRRGWLWLSRFGCRHAGKRGRSGDTVVASLPEDEEVIVVGHSLGGLVIPLVAEKRRVSHLVFLAALMPKPGMSVVDQRQAEPDSEGVALATYDYDAEGRLIMSPDFARERLFHDCSAEIAADAVRQLVPQAMTIINERTPVAAWPPTVPVSYVACLEDRQVPIEWARKAARERLGVDPVELPGGHSPFLSRPQLLVQTLLDIIEKG